MSGFLDDLQDLDVAEDFLRFFGVAYDKHVVDVNRLHILQRFHDYLGRVPGLDTQPEDRQRQLYRDAIARAYGDFVASDAIREKVFKVHQEQAERLTGHFVSLDSLTMRGVTQTAAPERGEPDRT